MSSGAGVRRRRVLAAAALLTAGGGTALGALVACASPPPPAPDPLADALRRARADADLAARAAASAADTGLGRALAQVATERRAHAGALAREIARAGGREGPGPSGTTTAAPGTTDAPPAPRPSDVVIALGASADAATADAVGTSGYRAGLAASVAAACTALVDTLPRRPDTPDAPDAQATPDMRDDTRGPDPEPTVGAAVGTGEDVRPRDPGDAALVDAVAAVHAALYGYGLVSAHSAPETNPLVATSMRELRALREAATAVLSARGVAAPVAAPGYRVGPPVGDPAEAAALAVRMETDGAVTWRVAVERVGTDTETVAGRRLAVAAVVGSAVRAARWRTVAGFRPTTVPFPGGRE